MRILLAVFVLFIAQASFAQKTWTLNEVGVGIGNQNDRILNMSMDWMRMYARSDDAFQVQLDGYEYSSYNDFMGTSLSLDLTFMKGEPTGKVTHELRIGARLVTEREAMIEYYRVDEQELGSYRESFIFCLVDDEIAGDVSYLKRRNGEYFSFYTGIGGSVGATFSSKLLRIRNASFNPEEIALPENSSEEIENTTDTFSAKNALFYRVQIPIGIQFHLRKWAFGPEFRAGVGGHSVFGGKSYFIAPTTSFSMRLSYFPNR